MVSKQLRDYEWLIAPEGPCSPFNAPEMPGLTLTLLDRKEDEKEFTKNLYTKWFDYDKIKCKPHSDPKIRGLFDG